MCNCNKKRCGNYLPIRCCCKPRPPPYCPEVKKLPPKKPCQKPCCNPCQKPCYNPCYNPCQKPCKPKHCCPDLTRPLPLKKNEDIHDNEGMEQDRQIQDLLKKIF